MKLAMFDVDGTLLDNYHSNDSCYVAAFRRAFGLRINSDWRIYSHCTDSCIARESLSAHFGRPPNEDEVARSRRALGAEIARSAALGDSVCRPTPGAASVFRALAASGWTTALASGGWRETALLKLELAGIDSTSVVGAFADDAISREGIAEVARRRAESSSGRIAARVVYLGDAEWDVRMCAALGLPFVGVGRGERAAALRLAGARSVVPDFRDTEALLGCLGGASVPKYGERVA